MFVADGEWRDERDCRCALIPRYRSWVCPLVRLTFQNQSRVRRKRCDKNASAGDRLDAGAMMSGIDVWPFVLYLFVHDISSSKRGFVLPFGADASARFHTDRKRNPNGFQTDISAEISRANASNGFDFAFFEFEMEKVVVAPRVSAGLLLVFAGFAEPWFREGPPTPEDGLWREELVPPA